MQCNCNCDIMVRNSYLNHLSFFFFFLCTCSIVPKDKNGSILNYL